MDEGHWPVSILILAGFIFLEAVFYGFGAAIQNVNKGKLEEEAERGSRQAARLLEMMEQPGRLVHTIQITTHLISMVTGAVILPVLAGQFGGLAGAGDPVWWELLLLRAAAVLILVAVIISFGILIPKRLALKAPEAWCYHMLPAVLTLVTLFWPLTVFITLISGLVLKVFGLELSEAEENVTEEDIMSMVNEGHEQGILEADETEMITNIFELGDKVASDIMIHRTSMVVLEGTMTLGEAVDFILNEGVNTRYPVYGEDIDDIIGILHLRDGATFRKEGVWEDKPIREIPGLLRKAEFIPETKNIDILFKEMQSKKIHMEIVVDEYGQTAGLLTMEDILEEIVGSILDEYDQEETFITARKDGSCLMSGLTPLEDAEDFLGIEFPEEDKENYDTLNGFLISRLNRIPKNDEKPEIIYGDYSFRVIKAGRKVIEMVLVHKAEQSAQE